MTIESYADWFRKFPQNFFLIGILIPITFSVSGCERLFAPLKPIQRLGSEAREKILIEDSISIERSSDETSVEVTFESKKSAQCTIGFTTVDDKSNQLPNLKPCAGKSTTKFAESITGTPKGQLIVIVIKAWDASATEGEGQIFKFNESFPNADNETIHLLTLDFKAGQAELSAIQNTEAPSSLLKKWTPTSAGCSLSDADALNISTNKKALLVQSANLRGFVSASLSRLSPSTLNTSFNAVQKTSTEWSLSAKTASGFGQLRFQRPNLLLNPIFAGSLQKEGLTNILEDLDIPALKTLSSSTFVATWSMDGNQKDAVAILSIQPAESFPGITCRGPGSDGRLVIPADMVAKLPQNKKLWATLRLDTWQALDKERWLVVSSDWSSMGIQRQ